MIQNQINDTLERFYLNLGYDCVVGIDEVGRGSWAGPVVVGAYIYNKSSKLIPSVNDSKRLTPRKRRLLNNELVNQSYYIAQANCREIDDINILEATKLAINRVIAKLDTLKFIVLLDGYFRHSFAFEHKCIKKGDQKHYSIAAASILAKVYRDDLMIKLSHKYPSYGFDTNVGYGTKKHLAGLERHGICEIHRRSYKPIRKIINSS